MTTMAAYEARRALLLEIRRRAVWGGFPLDIPAAVRAMDEACRRLGLDPKTAPVASIRAAIGAVWDPDLPLPPWMVGPKIKVTIDEDATIIHTDTDNDEGKDDETAKENENEKG